MCWIGKLELKKAEEDIPIFKIMEYKDNKLISYIRKFEYSLNKKYTSEIILDKNLSRIQKVSKALHSYDSSVNLNSIKILYYKFVKVNGIIPKGAVYCKNDRGEFISNQLVLKEITNEIQTLTESI